MENKKLHEQLVKYMHGIEFEFEKIRFGIWTWLKHGFHILILISVFIAGILTDRYYQETFSALKTKSENFSKIRNTKETSISINEKNELIIIDRPSQNAEIFSDSTVKLIWIMYGEKMSIKNNNEPVLKEEKKSKR